MSGRALPPWGAPAPVPQIEPLAAPELLPSALPVGWRPEDVLGYGDGFVSVEEAAKRMQISEERVAAIARAGLLEARGQRVRPAIVTVLAVNDPR